MTVAERNKRCAEKRKIRISTENVTLALTLHKKCLSCPGIKSLFEDFNGSSLECITCNVNKCDYRRAQRAGIKKDNEIRALTGQKKCYDCCQIKSIDANFTGTNGYCNDCSKIRCAEMGAYNNTVRGKFAHYKRDAKRSCTPFELTEGECAVLFSGKCHQCGISVAEKDGKLNGIDRMDNNVGYVLSNTVSCCWSCNEQKHSLDPVTVSLRRIHCRSIRLGTGQLFPEAWEDRLPATYRDYKHSAKRRNREFEMTKEQYTTLTNTPCCDCQRPITETNKSGIDCSDPIKGYVVGNMVSRCTECNLMKGTMTEEENVSSIFRIASHKDITVANTPSYIPRCLRYFARNTSRQQRNSK